VKLLVDRKSEREGEGPARTAGERERGFGWGVFWGFVWWGGGGGCGRGKDFL